MVEFKTLHDSLTVVERSRESYSFSFSFFSSDRNCGMLSTNRPLALVLAVDNPV
jgi:hypothetical protein